MEISSPSTELFLSMVKSRITRSVLGAGVDADEAIVNRWYSEYSKGGGECRIDYRRLSLIK